MNTVVYSCPFVPAEWIAAHELRPSRILPPGGAKMAPAAPEAGMCPYARAFVSWICSDPAAHAVVLTTTCDQMRRASEIVASASSRAVFLMHVPTTWQSPAAHNLYRSELMRLGRFLVGLGGAAPSNLRLAETMREFDSARSALRNFRGLGSARQFAQAIAEFHRRGEARFDPPAPAPRPRGTAVALLGGPLRASDFGLFDWVEQAGGNVVLDGTTSGERALPAPFDRRRLNDDPLGTLADAYFGAIPGAFRRPNTELHQWLKRETAARGVRGVLFRFYPWCDTWHAEAERVKGTIDLPLLAIEAGDGGGAETQARSAIQAFLEALQ